MFYLTKEILCDFILYCENKECCHQKFDLVKEIGEKEALKKEKMIKYLIDDLKLALKENIFTHKLQSDAEKNENNEI